MRIPPPGSDPAALAEYIDVLVREAAKDDRRLTWEIEAERCVNLYLGNHWDAGPNTTPEGDDDDCTTTAPKADGVVRVVLNRIQNCIVAIYAIQAGDPPKFTFVPRESGEPPITYLNTNLPQSKKVGDFLLREAQAAGDPWQPTDPIPDRPLQFLQQQIEIGKVLQAQAAMMGQPPPPVDYPPDLLIEVTDRTASETLQTVFDGTAEACDFQYAYAENVLNKNILGLQSTLYEFDDDAKQHVFTNVHQKQVFFDPIRSDMRRQQFAIFDEPVAADEAVAMYPDIAAEIMEAASEGPLKFPGSRPYDPAFRYSQTFYRDMVVIRHCWIRNQPYPMTPEQAVAAGKVVAQDVPTGEWDLAPHPETGEPVPVPATRTAYVLPATGEEVTPTVPDPDSGKDTRHPKWPCRYAIRQLRVVANVVVDDRECEFADIPLPTNINIPVPYSPYGQGEPVRLEGLQTALNNVLSAIVTHERYNACPPEVVAEGVVERMNKALQNARSKPGQRIIIPDALLAEIKDIKNLISTLDVPAVPADFWKLLQFLVEIIDKEGNQSDVLNGNASASWSGDAIASLQNAAAQVIRAKSMHTEHYLRRTARLMVHSIVHRMGPADWQRYCSKYPWQALQALHTRAKSLDVDISVQITSGSGAAKQSETNNLIAARNAKLPVSDPTLMERLNLDPDAELARQAEFDRKRMAAAPQQPMVANNPAQAGPQPPVVGGQAAPEGAAAA